MAGSVLHDVLILAMAGFVFCTVPLPALRWLFHRLHILDKPDNRKIHASPIPRVGGIALALAYVWASSLQGHELPILRFLIPLSLMFLTGLVDDLWGLTPLQKLWGQTAAACTAAALGIRISHLGDLVVPDVIGFGLTVAWLILCSNAFNLIDGMDGLCAGLGLIGLIGLAAAAISSGSIETARLAAPMIGALLGFLRLNLHRATIFLGDAGSLTIGFTVGCLGVNWSGVSSGPASIAIPIAMAALPLTDLAISVTRRWIAGTPIFAADRAHIHHKLLDRGFRPVLVLFVLCFTAAVGMSFALALFHPMAAKLGSLMAIGPLLLLWWGIRQLRYPEFRLRPSARLRQPLP